MNPIVQFLKSRVGMDAKGALSPLMEWLNPTLKAIDEGIVEFEHTVRPEMANPMNILHGGITASIIDDAIGAAVYSLNNSHYYTTVNLNVDYFAPAKVGDVLYATTTINKRGKQIINASCTVWNADKSRVIAKGNSNLMRTKMEVRAFPN